MNKLEPLLIHTRIAFTGRRGSGKNAAAALLVEEHDFVEIKFAGPLKTMLAAFYEDVGLPWSEVERRLEGDLKEVPCEWLCGRTPRHAMQMLGTEWRDTIDKNLWTELFKKGVNDHNLYGGQVVCTDFRFPHEGEALRELGFLTIRIKRDAANTADVAGQHISETAIDDLVVDHEVINDGSIEDLHKKVSELVFNHD